MEEKSGKTTNNIKTEFCKICGASTHTHVQIQCDYTMHMNYLRSTNTGTIKTMKCIEKAFIRYTKPNKSKD